MKREVMSNVAVVKQSSDVSSWMIFFSCVSGNCPVLLLRLVCEASTEQSRG